MRLSGKRSDSKNYLLLKTKLPVIAARIETLSSQTWGYKDIAFVMFGLQCFDEKDDGVISIISSMTKIASKTILKKEEVKAQSVSMILLGLQKMQCTTFECQEMIAVIIKMIIKVNDPINEQVVGNALLSLKSMNSNNSIVLQLISALTVKIKG